MKPVFYELCMTNLVEGISLSEAHREAVRLSNENGGCDVSFIHNDRIYRPVWTDRSVGIVEWPPLQSANAVNPQSTNDAQQSAKPKGANQ